MLVDSIIKTGPLPAVVFIPASFSPTSFYNKTIDKLRVIGIEAIIHSLPSASRRPPEQAATLAEDVAYFHDVVAKLVDQGKEVALVMHSYGGIVGTEVCRGLTKKEREGNGMKGGLVRLVYVTAVVPMLGQSLNDVLGSPANLKTQDGYMRNEPYEDCAKSQFSDLPLQEGVAWVKRMTVHSAASFADKLTFAGYNYLPVSWLLCEDDHILTADFQRQTIVMIERESGNKVAVSRLRAGHFPNASIPEDTANAIFEAITAE
ncbi:hypothetical protein H2204_004692 [Knufia peltigerae]|uniref:AB hydrolase-1 domain-containing protein n=1 Tax=Knufia peltigerae TaxID=1002370 RepID=A0AA38Y733_9EURO|nr:hypothetical protein H2204_004692 [Knufia peltigerae]